MYSLKTDLVTKPSRMVICAMIGCSNRSGRDEVRFFRLPKIVSDRGEQMLSVTMQRQLAWLIGKMLTLPQLIHFISTIPMDK